MDAKNVVQVQIFGHSYTIRGEADQEYITRVATYVDKKMREITDKLQAARSAISRRQPEQAAGILRTLRTDVAAQSGKALTAEAVALVDLNIQYMLPLVAKP